MKKLLTILAMLMLAVFVLTSCGGNANTPADTSDVNGGTETEAPESPFSIPEEDMRDWVVDYMFKMAEIKWTPSQTMDLTLDKKGNLVGKTLLFEKGKIYYGLPYINLTTDTDYEDFEAALKWNEGKQMYLYDCPADRSEDAALGNDCSSAILLAWKRFDTTISAYDTGSCFPLGEKSGIYPVGDMVVDGTEKTTDIIVQNTSDEAHFAAFAQLKKGDMVMWRLSNAATNGVAGHTRMVISVNVVKNGAGKINPHKSYVTTIEQTNAMDTSTYAEGKNTNWWVNHQYTFQTLREKNLIPVTCKALSEERVEPKFTVSNANSKKTIKSTKDELMGTIEGNYAILAGTVTIKGADGTVHYTERYKVPLTDLNGGSLSLKRFDFDFDCSTLPAGDYVYTVEIETICGNGEVYRVEFSK